jgi:flagellin
VIKLKVIIGGVLIMRINNNIQATNLSRNQEIVQKRIEEEQEKQASALRINEAKDDPAGLAISEQQRGQISAIRGIERTQESNLSALQVADQGLDEINNLLNRARELSIQRAGTNGADSQQAIDAELGQVFEQIESIEINTEFNGEQLFDGGANFKLSEGIEGEFEDVTIAEVNVVGPGNTTGIDDATDLQDITRIDAAIDVVLERRSEVGANQDRFEASVRNFEEQSINIQQAESRIRDADIAESEVQLTKDTLVQKTQQALAVQANQLPQLVQSLLS